MAVVLLVSVVAVNLVTIVVDLQAGAAGLGLLAGVDPRWLVTPLGAALASAAGVTGILDPRRDPGCCAASRVDRLR